MTSLKCHINEPLTECAVLLSTYLQYTSISAIIKPWHVFRKLPPLFVLPELNISCPFTLSFCLALIIQDTQGGADELAL